MNLHIHVLHLGTYLQRVVDLQQSVSICLVTRETLGCSAMPEPVKAVHRLTERWLSLRPFGSESIHVVGRAVRNLLSAIIAHG